MTETLRRKILLSRPDARPPSPPPPVPEEITEGALTFSFPNGFKARKYDDWTFYKKHFQSVAGGSKAVDILCIARGAAWLIEIKDYRQYSRKKTIDLCNEVAIKVRDTLSGLATAYANADDKAEKYFARRVVETGEWRVVLHLEQLDEGSRLWPTAINPANVRLKLRQKLKAVDPNAMVTDIRRLGDVPWSVREAQVVQLDE